MRDWEACYQTGDTPWDKGRAAPPLLEVIERYGRPLWGDGPVLVPGCGAGHDVRALAALGMPVLGLDIASGAIARAREFLTIGAETYEVGNFLDPSWGDGRHFSAIWEHTCYCAIEPQHRNDYAMAAAKVLDKAAILAGVFYLTPNDPGEEACGPPYNVTIAELDGCFSPWFDRIDAWVPATTYPGREGREWIAIYRRK